MEVQDLEAGDLIVSKKRHSEYNLPQRFFAWAISRVAKKHYGKHTVFPDATHIRVVVYKSDNLILTAHATMPMSTVEIAKDYFVDPEYALVARCKLLKPKPESWLKLFTGEYINQVYDVLDLLRIATGWSFLDLGKNHFVCSSLTANMQHDLLFIEPRGVSKDWVTPCYPLNEPERYRIMNQDRNKVLKSVFKTEPE